MRRSPTIALVVAISLVSAAGGTSAAELPDLASAHEALARGAFGDAITLYTELLQEGTLTGQLLAIAYRERGIAQQKAGFARHAVADYTNALWLDVLPSQLKAETYLSRGVAYLELGQLSRAEQDFAHAIANNKGLAEAYFGRGTVKRLREMPEQALGDYGQALRLGYARPALLHFGRGLAYEALERRDLALADFRHAAKLAPGVSAIRAKLAELGEPLAFSESGPAPPAPASPTTITVADAGDVIFAASEQGEPTGAINTSGNVTPASAAATQSTENRPDVPAEAQNPIEAPVAAAPRKAPFLRPGSDGPLAPPAVAKEPPPRLTSPSVPARGQEEPITAKPGALLDTAPPPAVAVASASAAHSERPGEFFVQMAAYNQKDSADKGLADFSTRFPELGKTARLFIQTAAVPNKGMVYRLRAGPFETADAAQAACRGLSAKGQDCLVVPPMRAALN
jgi:tetratricopeptide (TPR) repeat protein